MKYAVIEYGVVTNIVKADAPLEDTWVAAGDVQKGYLWDGETFSPPPPLPKYATAKEAKLAMTNWINRLTSQIQDEYPTVVQKGWEDEEAMALAFEAGTASQEQLDILASDASSKGRTSAEHATRILEKASAFRSIALQTRNLWLATDKAIEDASDPLQYEGILEAAIVQAEPLAAAYGLTL